MGPIQFAVIFPLLGLSACLGGAEPAPISPQPTTKNEANGVLKQPRNSAGNTASTVFRTDPADYTQDVSTLMADLAIANSASHRPIRALLEAARHKAHENRLLAREVMLVQRLDQLPPDTVAPEASAGTTSNNETDLDLRDIDERLQTARRAAEEQLAARSQALSDELAQALDAAMHRADGPGARQLWQMLAGLPHPWTEVLKNPVPGQPDYDRKEALPIPRLPAYLELTMEPGGHDVHIGLGGHDDEEVTEIYLGGWFSYGSGIRSSPGGEEVASKNTFRHFNPARPTTISKPERLLDPWQGTSFFVGQPTVFRLAISHAGVIIRRYEHGAFAPFMTTDRLFNHPTCIMLRSATYRLLSLRVFPESAWTDNSNVPNPLDKSPVNF